jgi:hypothetical protein
MFVCAFVQFIQNNNLFVMSVRPSVLKEKIGSQYTVFFTCVCFKNFSEFIEGIQVY